MKTKPKFTKKELTALKSAISFYLYEVSHGNANACAGLSETDKDYAPLKSTLDKLKES